MANKIDTPAQVICEACASCVHARIEEREASFISILDSIQDSVFSVDCNYRIITANKGFRERTFAFTGIVIKPGDSIFVKCENQHFIDPTINCIQRAMKGEAFKVDTEFVVDGKTIHRESTFTPIQQGSEIIGVSCYSKDVSSTKIAEEQLKGREMLFRSLLENSHDGIAMLSAGGRLKYISPSVGRILGYTFEEMVEIGMPGMVHPDDLSAVVSFSEKLASQYGKSDQIEYRMKSKVGIWKLIHCHYTNMLHEPSIKSFVVNYEDITERRELEIELENTVHDLIKADDRQSAIINSLRANIALLNQDGIIIEVNEAWKRFADDNQLVSKNYGVGDNYVEISEKAACAGEKTGGEVANGIRDVLAGKVAEFSLEYTCHSDTEKRWFKVIVYPLYKRNKGGVVVYHVDVTDRKLADLQIDFHRRNRDALINSTTDLMWSIDAEMRLITANNAFLSVIKTTSNVDLRSGDSLLLTIPYSKEEVQYWTAKFNRALAGEQFMEVVHRDNPFEYWAEVSFNPIWENGKVIGAACYSRDITKRKESERLLLQSQQMMAAAESIAHFGSWEHDLHNVDSLLENSLRWSDEVFRIFGYTPGSYEVTIDNFFKAVHPEDREPIRQAVQKAIDTNSSYSIHHRVLKPDGEVRWVHEEAKIIMNENTGKPLKMVGTVLDITERKQAEESLRLSNERYELVTKATNDAIWDWNLLTGELYWSEGYENLFGYSREEEGFTFETCTKRIHPDDYERVRSSLQKEISDPSSNSWHGEYRYIKSDGSIANVNNRGYIVHNGEGVAVRMVGAMQDITAQKLAEESLRLSNERYELVTKATNDAIWDWNLLTDEVYWSQGYENLFGYPRDINAVSNEIWTKRIHPDDVERIWSAVHKEITDPTSHFWQGEYRYMKYDGSIADVYDRGYIIYKEDGTPVRMVGAMQDVTARKKAEESLLKSEANLRTIFDHADRAYILLDKDFRILSFNTVATEWAKLVYNAEFKEGESIITYLEEEKKEEGKRILESVLEGHHLVHEAQYRTPDGTEKWFSVRRYPVRNEDGSILGICIASKDVTQRHQYQMERDKMTAEIVQRNKDLEQYAYIVSHNLRAPVANIVGFSDALLHTDLNEDEKWEMLNGLDVSIKRLDNVIMDLNNILQVKKEVNGMKETIRLSMLVNDIALSIGNTMAKEQVVVKTDFEQVDELFTLKSYMHSIFYNLISNSIKYRNPDVPPIIEIKSRGLEDKIELCFSDNGLGIDLQKKNGQVFGLYKRFHTQVAEGKGMGLFMVKTQVESLGGKITVESEVNMGTEFRIVLER
ncbi:MAG: PAS domain S-box protein [Saprospiraceae bacterium]|nr:PAS domain S-box protein [Saprospiraceae bacterium]